MSDIKIITGALKPAAVAVTTALLIAACGSDNAPSATTAMKTVKLDFTAQKLDPLGADFDYEGWIIVDGKPVSTGKFDVDSAGVLSPLTSQVAASDADKATKFILTIEPAKNDPPAPADTHIVAGDITQGATATANLTVSDGAALGSDFGTAVASGDFILASPSSAAVDDEKGIWFFNGAGAQGLTLPTLPAGWVYEGWAVINGTPVTTGRFTDPAAADLDGAGPDKGTDGCGSAGMGACPTFPGQDFVTTAPAVDLRGATAVISVEPEPDNAAAPFTLKPLVQAIGAAQALGGANPITFGNNAAATNPVGTMTIQ